jgi:hypothetical protein
MAMSSTGEKTMNFSAEEQAFFEKMPSLPAGCDNKTAALWASSLLLKTAEERGWDLVETRHAMLVLALMTCARDMTEIAIMAEVQEIVRRVLMNRRHSPGLGSH